MLIRMRALVTLKIVLLSEALLTMSASVWTISRVSSHVLGQIPLPIEPFAAGFALKRLLSSVNSRVIDEISMLMESLVADFA